MEELPKKNSRDSLRISSRLKATETTDDFYIGNTYFIVNDINTIPLNSFHLSN